MLGACGVGKTAFVNQYTKKVFNEEYIPTIISEYDLKRMNKVIELE